MVSANQRPEARCCRLVQIASLVNRAGISNLTGLAGAANIQGEDQKKLDVISNDVFCNALRASGRTVRAPRSALLHNSKRPRARPPCWKLVAYVERAVHPNWCLTVCPCCDLHNQFAAEFMHAKVVPVTVPDRLPMLCTSLALVQGTIASEEEDLPVAVEETYSGNYVVVFDPLDG